MNSVARVAAVAQVFWAILKIQSREKLQSRGLFFGLTYFYNLLRPRKVYIDKYKLK